MSSIKVTARQRHEGQAAGMSQHIAGARISTGIGYLFGVAAPILMVVTLVSVAVNEGVTRQHIGGFVFSLFCALVSDQAHKQARVWRAPADVMSDAVRSARYGKAALGFMLLALAILVPVGVTAIATNDVSWWHLTGLAAFTISFLAGSVCVERESILRHAARRAAEREDGATA